MRKVRSGLAVTVGVGCFFFSSVAVDASPALAAVPKCGGMSNGNSSFQTTVQFGSKTGDPNGGPENDCSYVIVLGSLYKETVPSQPAEVTGHYVLWGPDGRISDSGPDVKWGNPSGYTAALEKPVLRNYKNKLWCAAFKHGNTTVNQACVTV